MAKLVAVLLSLLSVLCGIIHGEDDIQCNLLPPGRAKSDASQVPAFGININTTEITKGSIYPVKVSIVNLAQHPQEFKRFRVFMLQAHDIEDKAHGRWESTSEVHITRKCHFGDADTLYNHPHMTPVPAVSALWYPPSEDLIHNEVDFNAAVVLTDGTFWTEIRSIMLKVKDVHTDSSEYEETGPDTDETEAQPQEPEISETGEDPNESEQMDEDQRQQEELRDNGDDHGLAHEEELARKAEEEKEALIRQEDDESETDGAREEEAERQREEEEQHQEMVEYERLMAEEETKRQEMIQWEIRDKEEHDRMLAEQTTRRPDVVDTKPDLVDGDKPPKDGDDKNNINPDLVVGDSAATFQFSLLLALLSAFLLLL